MALDKGLPHVGDEDHDCIIKVHETNADGSATNVVSFLTNPLDSQDIIIKDPDGNIKFSGTSTFKDGGSGTDGKIHVVLADIFDQPGPWTKQARLVFSGGIGPFHTEEIIFQVAGPRT